MMWIKLNVATLHTKGGRRRDREREKKKNTTFDVVATKPNAGGNV